MPVDRTTVIAGMMTTPPSGLAPASVPKRQGIGGDVHAHALIVTTARQGPSASRGGGGAESLVVGLEGPDAVILDELGEVAEDVEKPATGEPG